MWFNLNDDLICALGSDFLSRHRVSRGCLATGLIVFAHTLPTRVYFDGDIKLRAGVVAVGSFLTVTGGFLLLFLFCSSCFPLPISTAFILLLAARGLGFSASFLLA